jgi:hypothetical protein
MNQNSVKNLLLQNNILKSGFLDIKKNSFFLKRTNGFVSLYHYKPVFKQLKALVFILKDIKSKGGTIFFVGLSEKDYYNYNLFNQSLEKFVISKGHIYVDSTFKGFLYNRWSLTTRRSHPSQFFLNLQKNNRMPSVLFSFSKETDNVIFKEFTKFGLPIIYFLEGYSYFECKDYPLMGLYSSKMLNFYLRILKYCL